MALMQKFQICRLACKFPVVEAYTPFSARHMSSSGSSESSLAEAKPGTRLSVADFCKAVGGGVETHAEKVAGEVASVTDLLCVRSGMLKGLSIPVKQVKVLALTDHDTMAGVREAMITGMAHGVRVIPGVEISATSAASGEEGKGTRLDNVHILAYFGLGGPARWRDVEACLTRIREGRYIRARQMVAKLSKLSAPVTWQNVMKFVTGGGAPGRRHLAMALVEAGHVSSEREAFSLFIGDGGPAYASGAEPPAEDVVRLIASAGGVSVMAHPWTLTTGKGGHKGCYHLLQRLCAVGLLGLEVYKEPRTDSQHFREWAEALGLLKVGGSDFHGRGGNEIDVGGSLLPPQAAWEFLVQSQHVWGEALRQRLQTFARDETCVDTLDTAWSQNEDVSVRVVTEDSDRSCDEGSVVKDPSVDVDLESRRMVGNSVSWHEGENEGKRLSLDFVTDVEVLIVKDEVERLGLVWCRGQS